MDPSAWPRRWGSSHALWSGPGRVPLCELLVAVPEPQWRTEGPGPQSLGEVPGGHLPGVAATDPSSALRLCVWLLIFPGMLEITTLHRRQGGGATHGGRFASAACPNLVSDRGGNRLKPHTGIISRIERSESELHLTELKPGCQQHSLPS